MGIKRKDSVSIFRGHQAFVFILSSIRDDLVAGIERLAT